MKTSEFCKWVNGECEGAVPEELHGATFDSRKVSAGCLYAALKGEKSDGHNYVEQALAGGAAAALVRKDYVAPREGLALIRVNEPREALTAAAREYRKTLKAKVIGLTGSAGKTTTKELTAAFLRAGFKTFATPGNFNNDLGLPITILNTPSDTECAVYEMGTNHPGEIAHLVNIGAPDIGLVSSIGTAHIEFFKTQDGIAQEKGTILRELPAEGFAVLSRQNARFAMLKEMSAARVVEVSLEDESADYFGRIIDEQTGEMEVEGVRIVTGLPGTHNCSNALIAYACARELGVTKEQCAGALEGFSLPGQRWRVSVINGVTWVNDAYNANPTSMIAALETFAARKTSGRKIAVLGDMFELGEQAETLHRMVGKRAAELPVELISVGEQANKWIGGKCAKNIEEARAMLAATIHEGDEVLLKASRGMALDRLVPSL